MKKIILLIIICSTTICFSQERKFVLGINAGTTFSDFRGESIFIEESKPKFNFLTGLSLEYNFKNNMSLVANINYTNKSFSSTENRSNNPFINPDGLIIRVLETD